MISRGRNCKNQITKFFLASFLLVLAVSVQDVRPEDFNYGPEAAALADNCQLDNVLQSLLTPEELSSMHVQALRQELIRILNNEALRENHIGSYESNYDDKRSIAALAKSSQFPFDYKRNVGSLARSGYLKGTSYKRSIATLAKNGQLPTLQSPEEETETDTEEQKRGIESLARSGSMNRYLKKSLASLARGGYYPGKSYDDNNYDNKRNIGALARNGYLKRDIDNFMDAVYQKRNIGSLARQFNLPGGKRYMGSLMRNGGFSRYARSDYEDLYEEDKRNLQSLARSGDVLGGKRNLASLVRNQNSRFYDYKRNIGAIARDWALPNHSYDRNEDDKRNVAALLRQDSYLHTLNRNHPNDVHPTADLEDGLSIENKRNIASLKAQATPAYANRHVKRSINQESKPNQIRIKRQSDDYFAGISDEYSVPVMQNTNALDYEDLMNSLNDNYPVYDKRFLGNIPLSRMAELGKLSMMGQSTSNTTPTSPTYRRRQYLLSRTSPEDNE